MANIENNIINQMKQSESGEFFKSDIKLRNHRDVHHKLLSIVEDEFFKRFPKKIVGYKYQENIFWEIIELMSKKEKMIYFLEKEKLKNLWEIKKGKNFLMTHQNTFMTKQN